MNPLSEKMCPKDRDEYKRLLGRIKYDDRDYIMYRDMLDYLWEYVVGRKQTEDPDWIYEEFTHWNMEIIRKVLYHEHDIPYAHIRRCYQTIVELIRQDPDAGLKQLDEIGADRFTYDGLAPKLRMDSRGRVYHPMSKLFIIYNFAKYYRKHGMEDDLERLKEKYPYPFRRFDDEEHKAHDQFLTEQMEDLADVILYPVEERVYKLPWKPRDFFLYYDNESFIKL